MCACIKSVNAVLENHNGRLSVGIHVTEDMSLKGRLLIATEKIDKTKREPIPHVTASFCPFCGEKAAA